MALGSGLRETGELLRGLRGSGAKDLRVKKERPAAVAAVARARSRSRIGERESGAPERRWRRRQQGRVAPGVAGGSASHEGAIKGQAFVRGGTRRVARRSGARGLYAEDAEGRAQRVRARPSAGRRSVAEGECRQRRRRDCRTVTTNALYRRRRDRLSVQAPSPHVQIVQHTLHSREGHEGRAGQERTLSMKRNYHFSH